jgi:signal peptidase I
MRDAFSILFVLALIGLETTFWLSNPLHMPATFVPARAFGVQVFQQLDTSMEPTLSAGEHVLVSSWRYWRTAPQAGDLIVFQYPDNPAIADFKRVIAAGGSTVEIRDGTTYVDGRPLPEPYLSAGHSRARDSLELKARHIPAGSYFVMGDNRDQSRDSRDYGPIPRSRILGRQWSP